MKNRNTTKAKTFMYMGERYKKPVRLDENIRAWFVHNSPYEPQIDRIPRHARFSDVKNVLTATTYEELPDWYATLDSEPRDLILYCCVEARIEK